MPTISYFAVMTPPPQIHDYVMDTLKTLGAVTPHRAYPIDDFLKKLLQQKNKATNIYDHEDGLTQFKNYLNKGSFTNYVSMFYVFFDPHTPPFRGHLYSSPSDDKRLLIRL